jgi:hypothetical protein
LDRREVQVGGFERGVEARGRDRRFAALITKPGRHGPRRRTIHEFRAQAPFKTPLSPPVRRSLGEGG